jgi:hypothetical protein
MSAVDAVKRLLRRSTIVPVGIEPVTLRLAKPGVKFASAVLSQV